MLIYILPIIIGYLIGSVSPSYILGRLIKHIDIREVGDKNAGTTNTYHVLGIFPAVITAVYDLGKGLLAMYAAYIIGAPEPIWYLAGVAAIIGHVFPFYLQFRGGQGVATTVGLLFYTLFMLSKENFVPWESLGMVALIVLAIFFITRQKGYLAFVAMPALLFLVLKNYPFNNLTVFAVALILYILAINFYEAVRKKLFKLKEETVKKISVWRTLARPAAVAIPIAYFYLDKNIILWAVGIIALIPFLVDLVRLISTKANDYFFVHKKIVYKEREKKRFSSITLFLLSVFITILVFDKSIAITAIMFLIFGDVFAKFFGSEFGKTKIGDKTLEGSIAFFVVCLLVGYLLWPYVGLSPIVIISGAFFAAIFELAPLGINDNFSISLGSAVTMLVINNYIL